MTTGMRVVLTVSKVIVLFLLAGCGLGDAVNSGVQSPNTSPSQSTLTKTQALDSIGEVINARDTIQEMSIQMIDTSIFQAVKTALTKFRVQITEPLLIRAADGCFSPDISPSHLGLWKVDKACTSTPPLNDVELGLWRSAVLARGYDIEMQNSGIYEEGRPDTYAYYVPGENGWGTVSDSSTRNKFNFLAKDGVLVCITSATTLTSNDARVSAGKC